MSVLHTKRKVDFQLLLNIILILFFDHFFEVAKQTENIMPEVEIHMSKEWHLESGKSSPLMSLEQKADWPMCVG